MNVTRFGWALVHFCWQGAILALLYATTRRFTRGANARYLLACAALASMMAAPVVTWLVLGQPDTPAIAADRTARVPGAISSAPVALPIAVRASVPAEQTPWLRWAVAIWLLGASLFSLRLLGGWLTAARLRWRLARPAPFEWHQAIERLRARIGLSREVVLRVSASVESPTVIGALRPLVLLPVGMLAGLPAAQVEALLLHELAHIRRHDYLVNLLQSAVEALLFYHPAVWWVSGHIRAEREHCCDDVAVAAGGDVLSYVSALAELESRRPAHLAAVAANGASLADRIARLLGESRPASDRRGTLLAAALLLVAAYGAFAQSERPAFQVASVKLNTANPPRHTVRPTPGGSLRTENAFLQQLIQVAYGIQSYQLIGGPSWMTTDGFDIEAKPETEVKTPQMLLMLQSLLADRFKLALHRETRDLPVYLLTPAKGSFNPPPLKESTCVSLDSGSTLPPSASPCGMVRTGFTGSVDGDRVPMANLVQTLAGILGRPVVDHTGYTGALDVHLKFTPDETTQGLPTGGLSAPPAAADPSRHLFDVLEEQLGLKLSSSKGPVEVLVIDHLERPTAN